MTPAARIAAAIGILDRINGGDPSEQALLRWARASRYAGSGDRAAVRDHVFDALRCRRSYAWLGGDETGRGLMIGALREAGVDPASVFTGESYAPAPLAAEETVLRDMSDAPRGVRLDCPDWLLPLFDAALGAEADAVLAAGRTRAPVFLRVNMRKATVQTATAALAADGIGTRPRGLSKTALQVTENSRKIRTCRAYSDGLVELQDVASQAVSDLLPLADGDRVLDYCAGGGGKSLAMAGRAEAAFHAYDIDPGRMADLDTRVARAGVTVTKLQTADLAATDPFDLVVADAPCSGSGSWRRAPEAKWTFSPERLAELCDLQRDILAAAARHVRPEGHLAYVTCSLLDAENAEQITGFLDRNAGWSLRTERRFTPLEGGDGFHVAILQRI